MANEATVTPDDWRDEDLIEELLQRYGEFSDEQFRIELDRMIREQGSAEKALDRVEQRLEVGVNAVLSAVEQQGKVYGILVAVRDELLEQTDEGQADDDGDDDDEGPESGPRDAD